MEEVPDNTTLKPGLNEVTQYIKVAQKVAEKLNFANGTSSFTNKPTMEPSEVPDTSPVKTIKLRKRRKSLSDNEEEEAEGEKEGDGNQGSEGVEKGEKGLKAVGEEGEPPAKKKRKWTVNVVMNSITVANSLKVLLISISIYRQNTKLPGWCSRSNWIKGKEGEEGHWEACHEVCSKCNSLWSHFRRKHEGRYHHYCLIGIADSGQMSCGTLTCTTIKSMTLHCRTNKNVQNVSKVSGKLGNTRHILLLVKRIHTHLYATFVMKPFGRGQYTPAI